MPEKALKKLTKQYHLGVEQLEELSRLLDAHYSPFYILRYRKDLAGNSTASDLDDLLEKHRQFQALEKERKKILKKLEENGTLTEDLEQKANSAETMRELLDYYVPFRPRKHSRSRRAITQGLEPLARGVLAQEQRIPLMSEAAESCRDPENGLNTVGDVLDGVLHVISDWIAEEKTHRDVQRKLLRAQGSVQARSVGKTLPARLRGEFREFLNFEAKVKDLHPYQMLCLMRGQRAKVLTFTVQPPLFAMCRATADRYMRGKSEEFNQIDAAFHDADPIPEGESLGRLSSSEFLYFCIRQSLCDVLAPILSRELERELCREAEQMALNIVARSVRSLLMAAPLKGQRVLAVLPGYRTGCKLAALDEAGGVLDTCIVYPHTPRLETEEAKARIVELVQKHNIGVGALADGTAFQETELLISEIIEKSCPELRYSVVSAVGADAYATSQLARKEVHELSPELRATVAIGRRLQDPLLELTKVSLRSLCSSQYAEDLNSATLKRTISRVAEECIAEVGVDVNTAPQTILRYAPGLNSTAASELVSYRDQAGPFADRMALKNVPKLDEDTWRRAVGFLKVGCSENPLDVSRIHPDAYPVATAILEQLGASVQDLRSKETRDGIKSRRGEVDFAELEKRLGVHYLLIKDILDELSDPWPDPRAKDQEALLRGRRLSFEDLQVDQMLMGTVRKVVDFGAFVDVGLGEDGLVHISEMSDGFVRSPHDVVSVGELIKVRVMEVDLEKRRIALSMRSERARKAAPGAAAQRRRDKEAAAPARRPRRQSAEVAGDSPVHRPQSTLGPDSRRVQKAATFKAPPRAKTEAAKPEPRKASAPQEQAPAKTAQEDIGQLSNLLRKLEFATIEKRGKPSNESQG